MLDSFLYSLLLIMALAGILIFLYTLVSKCLCSGAKRDYFTVIAGYEERESLIDEVYCAVAQLHLLTECRKTPLIIVDYNLSAETKVRCISVAAPYSPVIFCSEQELGKIISGNMSD